MKSADELLLERLLARWRETRSTALAARIDALSERAAAGLPDVTSATEHGLTEVWLERAEAQRAGDLARLVAVFTRAHSRDHIDQRLGALVDWPADPRVATLLMGFFEAPQWTGEHAKRFWAMAGELLVTLGDHRALPVLARIEKTADRRDKSYLMKWFARHVPKLRERLAATKVTELAAAELARIDEEIAGTAPPKQTSASPEALLADIYAHPDDDAPRLVYADYLTAHGDPRGELIVLQLAGTPTPAQRKRANQLVAAHGRKWLGAIEPVVLASGLELAGGFVSRCRVQARVDQIAKPMIGRDEWRTLRAIDVANWEGETWLELVRHDAMAGVRELTGAASEILDGKQALPYSHLGLGRGSHSGYEPWIAPLVRCATLPALRSLHLHGYWGDAAGLAKLWKSKLGSQLERFTTTSGALAPWFEQLSGVTQLASFALEHVGRRAGWSLEATRDGEAFALAAHYHDRNKYSRPYDELWAHLEAMTPARVARLAIQLAKPLGDPKALRARFAKRFPGVELAV